MSPEAFAAAALALPGATHQVQWGDEQVYKVGGKMFAVTDVAASALSIKVSEIAYEALIESGRARTAPIWRAPNGCASTIWRSWTTRRWRTG